jgi:hypothetical protein
MRSPDRDAEVFSLTDLCQAQEQDARFVELTRSAALSVGTVFDPGWTRSVPTVRTRCT